MIIIDLFDALNSQTLIGTHVKDTQATTTRLKLHWLVILQGFAHRMAQILVCRINFY